MRPSPGGPAALMEPLPRMLQPKWLRRKEGGGTRRRRRAGGGRGRRRKGAHGSESGPQGPLQAAPGRGDEDFHARPETVETEKRGALIFALSRG